MKEQNVEKLFKDTFSNFEADVNPSMWTNIEQNLPSPNVPAAKPSGFFAKMSLNAIIFVAAISATLVGTALYLSSEKSVSKDTVVQNVQASQPAKEVSVTLTPAPPIDATPAPVYPVVTKSKNTAAEKQTATKAEEKVIANETSQAASHLNGTTAEVAEPSNTSNTNSMQVSPGSDETKTASEPVVSLQENTMVAQGKVSVNMVQRGQNEAAKNFASPSHELATPSTGFVAVSEEMMDPAERKEEFHFFIPNVFTPDGNMINDNFKPVVSTNLKEYEMTIYDRYGFEIFKTRDIDFGWDGKLKNGNVSATAVYVYIIKLIDFKDEPHDYIGYVALVK